MSAHVCLDPGGVTKNLTLHRRKKIFFSSKIHGVQNSSIGDLVTNSLTNSLTHSLSQGTFTFDIQSDPRDL